MLIQQTINNLRELRLAGMAKGFENQMTSAAAMSLGFDERFSMLVEYEKTHRENERLKRLLKSRQTLAWRMLIIGQIVGWTRVKW